jgi:chemotaxis signal transduction protein
MTTSLLPIRLDSEWLLIDAVNVREILGAETWIPIPHTRPELPGVLAWRGRAIPVLDLGPVFGAAALAPRQTRARTLIVELERSVVAIPVDAAREVQNLKASELRPPHAKALPFSNNEAELFSSVMPVIDLTGMVAQITSPKVSENLLGAASA